ncbi:MAG: TonB-dependent receptor plug domain-containing protein, partial [Acidobacteriota bacterium]|nr:TonB-dependent receptor plug domain-containing protein [Acidobacteriota bacterium]
ETETSNPQSATPTTLVRRSEIAQTPGADRTNSLQMITDFVPGAYMTHDMLHVRGGHQVSWLIDGVPIPNTNIASNLGPQVDPKDIDFLDAQRGSYDASYGDRTYGVFDVVPKNGFDMNNEGELAISFGNFYQTDDYFSAGGHSDALAYYASLDGNRSNLGLETPVARIVHDAENGFGGFGSLMYNAGTSDQLRLVGSLRRDFYRIPYDPNPADFENSQFDTSSLRDSQEEGDGYALVSWIHTFTPNAVLTLSPFYHYNSANYRGSSSDRPIATTALRASNYGGGQASMAVTLPHNDAEIGVYSFFQHDKQTFKLIFNPPTQLPVIGAANLSGATESLFLSDKLAAASWLTVTGGLRYTHFSGGISEDATDPRIGAALRIPRINWVLRAFYGRYYQPPPLASISGPLLQFCTESGCSFVPLDGERDEEHQFGLTIPVRGWTLDFDTFETHSRNYFDHNNIGESEVFSPVTIAEARIRGNEVTVNSPNLWNRIQMHLAYSNQMAQARGPINGGLICFNPGDPAACAFSTGYAPLDHDQRNTLNAGFHANLPWQGRISSNVYYGSGFTNGDAGIAGAPYQGRYLPGHTTIDVSLGKDFGEKYS